MRQEVQLAVVITYDCDATLTRDQLRAEFADDLARLLDPDSGARVAAQSVRVLDIVEEAQLYSAGAE